MALALALFNEYLDLLNATPRAIYANVFTTYPLTPNLQPHTIGPTGTFDQPIRPRKIIWANYLLTGTTQPIRIKLYVDNTGDWWREISAQTIATSVSSGVYYSPDWPNGSLYFWPIPNIAYSVELETDTLFTQVLQTTTFSMPMGYQAALRLSLAERLAPMFGQTVSPETMRNAKDARAQVWGDNDEIPDLNTCDGGTPTLAGRRGLFNYLTGRVGTDH